MVVNEYRFGDVINVGDTPCFKIDRYGIVTVFVSMQKKLTKQTVTYESVLHLINKQKIDEKIILVEKSAK